jgi:hypothetical protein
MSDICVSAWISKLSKKDTFIQTGFLIGPDPVLYSALIGPRIVRHGGFLRINKYFQRRLLEK